MKSYLWNGELELGLPFGGKAQLCTQEVSQGKYWTQAMSKKATKCLQQQTASFAATMWHSKVGSLQTHWTSTGANATAQLHSPQPSWSLHLRPVQASLQQERGLAEMARAFLATARSGLASFPPGRNINWGSRLPNLLLLQSRDRSDQFISSFWTRYFMC